MKKLMITILAFIIGICLISCKSYEESFISDSTVTVEMNEIEESILAELETEESISQEWNTARMDFYDPYMVEPETCVTYQDCFDILCYIILNDIDEYEVVVENPEYIDGEVQGITADDVTQAYENVTLLLNTYTDFWSGLSVVSEEDINSDGVVIEITYTFQLYHKDGMDNEEVKIKIAEAEEACIEIVNQMFEEGSLDYTMTDKEKSYVCYTWICENVTYAYDSPDADSDEIKQDNFYNAIIEGEAVCQGITGAYIELCRLCGVEMYIQLGSTYDGAHSWCKIEDNGTWMYIDPTWAISGSHEDDTYKDNWFWVTQEFMENYSGHPREFW